MIDEIRKMKENSKLEDTIKKKVMLGPVIHRDLKICKKIRSLMNFFLK